MREMLSLALPGSHDEFLLHQAGKKRRESREVAYSVGSGMYPDFNKYIQVRRIFVLNFFTTYLVLDDGPC